MKKILSILLLTLSFVITSCVQKVEKKKSYGIFNFPNIINVKKPPENKKDLSAFCHFDSGSWLGYSLPSSSTETGSIKGPFSAIHSEWISNSIAKIFFVAPVTNRIYKPEDYKNVKINSYPGLLSQNFEVASFKADLKLFFVSSQTAIVKLKLTNVSSSDKALKFGWEGMLNEEYNFTPAENSINMSFKKIELLHNISVNSSEKGEFKLNSDKNRYYFHPYNITKIAAGKSFSTLLAISISSDEKEKNIENTLIKKVFADSQKFYNKTIKRWNKYLSKIMTSHSKWSKIKTYDTIAVKSLITLINNWKAPIGILKHDGLFPAYSTGYFNGFWAWDSWKHSVALVHFEPELAKNQIRTMFDFQNEQGMIVDCMNTDETNNYNSWNLNWLNTKPPLATWAVWKVFEKTGDLKFLKEMYPKLEKYHYWWFKNRDHDKNGICEYGSSLPKVYACKWESGMDDGVRFDKSKMIKNNDNSNSLTQESIDLNSFLVYEKKLLSKISEELKNKTKVDKYISEAQILKNKIQNLMFDPSTGYFYDITLKEKKHIVVMGSEGWIPLWTKVATKQQAAKAVKNMLDPEKFGTFIPLPTISKEHPKFFSKGNYWRGPVWLDQVYFGINALKNYGYTKEADNYTKQIFERLEGLKSPGLAIRENYNPLTGKGKFGHNFSWSAAHLLLLYMDK